MSHVVKCSNAACDYTKEYARWTDAPSKWTCAKCAGTVGASEYRPHPTRIVSEEYIPNAVYGKTARPLDAVSPYPTGIVSEYDPRIKVYVEPANKVYENMRERLHELERGLLEKAADQKVPRTYQCSGGCSRYGGPDPFRCAQCSRMRDVRSLARRTGELEQVCTAAVEILESKRPAWPDDARQVAVMLRNVLESGDGE